MKKLMIISLAALCQLTYTLHTQAEEKTDWRSKVNLGIYSSTDLTFDRDSQTNAGINEFSFWLSSNNDSRWQFFSEIEIEDPLSWNNGEKFNNAGSSINIERLYLDYNLSEKLNVRVGRFLTPNSRWNLLHAAPLVWTTTRPMATNWLFPIGTNGIMLFGALPFMDSAFEYSVFSEVLEDQKVEDQELRFQHVYGTRFSFKKDISEIGLSFLSFREKDLNQNYHMLGLDFFTYIKDIEVSGEAFHRLTKSNSDGGSGAYLQTAVPLNHIGMPDWFWITRLETLNRPDDGAVNRWLLGATWRIKPRRLLKFEFTGGDEAYPDAPRGFLTSFALFF